MKYNLLCVSTEPNVKVGDYILAFVFALFLPHIDGIILCEGNKILQKRIMLGYN